MARCASRKSPGAACFAKWDKESAQIQNENIRSRSEARQAEVGGKFSQISQTYEETKLAFQPFMSDLREVQKYLAMDLTAGAVAGPATGGGTIRPPRVAWATAVRPTPDGEGSSSSRNIVNMSKWLVFAFAQVVFASA